MIAQLLTLIQSKSAIGMFLLELKIKIEDGEERGS
jgi:hypothetical protein